MDESALDACDIMNLLSWPPILRIDPAATPLEIFDDICGRTAPVEGNVVDDCRIPAIMRENGVADILTHDTSFRRITGIRVLHSLTEERPEI